MPNDEDAVERPLTGKTTENEPQQSESLEERLWGELISAQAWAHESPEHTLLALARAMALFEPKAGDECAGCGHTYRGHYRTHGSDFIHGCAVRTGMSSLSCYCRGFSIAWGRLVKG